MYAGLCGSGPIFARSVATYRSMLRGVTITVLPHTAFRMSSRVSARPRRDTKHANRPNSLTVSSISLPLRNNLSTSVPHHRVEFSRPHRGLNGPGIWRKTSQLWIGQHCFPGGLVLTYTDLAPGANQRQAQQHRFSLDSRQQLRIRESEIAETGIEIWLAFCVQETGQAKTLNKSPDFARSQWFPLEIDEMNGYAALLEETLGRTNGG